MGLKVARNPDLSDDLTFAFSIYEPVGSMSVTYNGSRPIRFMNEIIPLMKKPLGAGSAGFWDVFQGYDGTDGSFKRYCQAYRKLDQNTTLNLWVQINGSQDLKSSNGKVTITFKPWIDVKFKYYNFLQKALVNMYFYIYYNQIVKKHLSWSKRMADNFKQGLLEMGAIEGPKPE